MCSRYSLTSPPEAVRAYFGYAENPNFPARYNIAPTQTHCSCLRRPRRHAALQADALGIAAVFVKDPKTFPTLINARSEDVLDKPSFRSAMRWRRCLIPADGFYEWTGPKGKRGPFLLHPSSPKLIAFAGLYERCRDGQGERSIWSQF
jgi:putative SOS response-associated peptidase YedK